MLECCFFRHLFYTLLDQVNVHRLGAMDVGVGVVRAWHPLGVLLHDDIALLQIGRVLGKMVDYFPGTGRRGNVFFGPDRSEKVLLGQFVLSIFGIAVDSMFSFKLDNTYTYIC